MPALFVSLVMLVAAAKKSKKCLGRCGVCCGHITKLEQSIFFRYLWQKQMEHLLAGVEYVDYVEKIIPVINALSSEPVSYLPNLLLLYNSIVYCHGTTSKLFTPPPLPPPFLNFLSEIIKN